MGDTLVWVPEGSLYKKAVLFLLLGFDEPTGGRCPSHLPWRGQRFLPYRSSSAGRALKIYPGPLKHVVSLESVAA